MLQFIGKNVFWQHTF